MFIRNTPELINNENIKTYACGSPPLHDFLEKNGFSSIYKYRHEINHKTIWIYILNNELSDILKIWSENNPNLKGGE